MARPVSAECAPVTRVPLGNFTDAGPRDIDPPHFKKSCLPHHPLHSGAKCSPPLCHMADFGTFTVTGASKTVTLPAWWCAGPTDWSCSPYFCSDSLPRVRPSSLIGASCLWSAGQKMERRSAFRTLVLPACVIICSNVLCPVGAYLYNNRYAGWVKTPHSFVRGLRVPGRRARTAGKAHGTSFFCREPHAKDGLYLAQRGSLCSPPLLFWVVFTFKT